MQYKTFSLLPTGGFSKAEDSYVSFKRFSEFLEDKLKQSDTLRAKYYRFVLKHFKKNPELLASVKIDELEKYKYLFELLDNIILPHLANENEVALALSSPMSGKFFFSTTAFQNLILKRLAGKKDKVVDEETAHFITRKNKMHYTLVLERFYGLQPFIKEEMVHVFNDDETKLTSYYSIDIDNRFVDVTHEVKLPKINSKHVQQLLSNNASSEELEAALPLHAFTFSGFSIVTATNITPRYALHKMRSAIIKHNAGEYNNTFTTILQLLSELCGRKDIAFGLLPFFKLNDKLVSYYENYAHSIIINACKELNISETTFLDWINSYFKQPETFIKRECDAGDQESDELYRVFQQVGFKGYALVPVFYNNEMTGILEVSAKDESLLDAILFTRIESASPILGTLMHQSQTEFAAGITQVIRQHFTTIQPSVLWKFNEVAWNYIKNADNQSLHKMEEIRFENVHPFYGAVDIRNSTLERNNALHKDMRFYLKMVKNLLENLLAEGRSTINKLTNDTNLLTTQMDNIFTGNEEFTLDALMEKVNSFLGKVDDTPLHNKNLIKKYFKDIDAKNGKAYANRRILENAIQYINFVIAGYIEKMQEELQLHYPVYFEKIRTDGIEYDIYLGASISPLKTYKKTFLNELRLKQLSNMAAITQLVYATAKSLPIPLETTQLIYVNASAIDITFRTDEKRFDVEGGYNIRYHIVKKRIDKVHVRDSGERLTQPGKLAIIYTQPRHEKEYLEYIQQLQTQNILKQNVELLELEELQGVTGLKAIRVEVNLN